MEILSIGSSGGEVTMLQRALSFLGANLIIDSSYGTQTKSAVTAFQQAHQLEPDGRVGPQTWMVLDNLVPQGIDISHQDGYIDWDNLSGHIQFIYCKASQGGNFKDQMLLQNIHAIRNKQLICGAYHFVTFNAPAVLQAENYLACGMDFSLPGTLPPALDIEWQVGATDAETKSLNQFIADNPETCKSIIDGILEIVQERTGRVPVIYTARSFWEEYFGNYDLSPYPLWVPAYQTARPGMPAGWSDFSIWQFSGNGTVPGVSSAVDQNLFNGSRSDLNGFAA